MGPGRQDQGKAGRAHGSAGSLQAACEGVAGPRQRRGEGQLCHGGPFRSETAGVRLAPEGDGGPGAAPAGFACRAHSRPLGVGAIPRATRDGAEGLEWRLGHLTGSGRAVPPLGKKLT